MNRLLLTACSLLVAATAVSCKSADSGGTTGPQADSHFHKILGMEKELLSEAEFGAAVNRMNSVLSQVGLLNIQSLDPGKRIDAVNNVLVKGGIISVADEIMGIEQSEEFSEGYPATGAAVNPPKKSRNPMLLSTLLLDGKGTCMSISLLYYLVFRHFGVPVHIVHVPQHAFVRYDDSTYRRNIETTSGGNEVADEKYMERLRFDPEQAARTGYLRNMGDAELDCILACNLAQVLYMGKKADRAGKMLEEAVRSMPGFIHARIFLAEFHLSEGKYDAAEEQARKALEISPKRILALQLLFKILYAKGKKQEAAGQLLRVLEIHERNYFALLLLGRVFCELKDFKRGLEYFDRAEKQFADNADLMCLKGAALVESQTPGDHEHYFRRALDLAPENRKVLDCFGRYLLNKGRFAQAKEMFGRFLALDPDDCLPKMLMAVSCFNLMQFGQTVDLTDEVLRTKTDPATVLTSAIAELYLRNLAQSREKLARLQRAGLKHPALSYYCALTELLLGNESNALRELQRGLGIGASFPRILALHACMLLKKGKRSEADAKLAAYLSATLKESGLSDLKWLFLDICILENYAFGVRLAGELAKLLGDGRIIFLRGYCHDASAQRKKAVADYEVFVAKHGSMENDFDRLVTSWMLERIEKVRKGRPAFDFLGKFVYRLMVLRCFGG